MRAPLAMIRECLISQVFDDIGLPCEELIPAPIRIDLGEQNRADRFLLLFREFLRNRVGLIEKVRHGSAF
jgi:hypothetical protein